MNAGDELPSRTVLVDSAAILVLADVLRDPNPIHLDPFAAAAAGLGDRVVNQGPANLAYIIDMLARALPHHRLVTIESRYMANVRGGDSVTAGGRVFPSVVTGELKCEVWLRAADGMVVVSGTATLEPRRA